MIFIPDTHSYRAVNIIIVHNYFFIIYEFLIILVKTKKYTMPFFFHSAPLPSSSSYIHGKMHVLLKILQDIRKRKPPPPRTPPHCLPLYHSLWRSDAHRGPETWTGPAALSTGVRARCPGMFHISMQMCDRCGVPGAQRLVTGT